MVRYVYCADCQTMTQPDSKIHLCVKYDGKGQRVSVLGKRWDSRLNCWVLANEEDVRKGQRVYDEKSNRWMDSEEYKKSKEEKTEASYSACELPKRSSIHQPMKGADGKHYKSCTCNECRPVEIRPHSDNCICKGCKDFRISKGLLADPYTYVHTPYVPVKPWDGIDRKKWPNTWMWLFGLYYIGSRWYNGKTIPDSDFRDRVEKGIYKPEPKGYGHGYHAGVYGPYWGDHDHYD